MKNDLLDLARIAELPDSEFEVFQTALKLLLSKTFIIRGIPKEEAIYSFAIRNGALFDAWCACIDAQLVRDEGLGIFAFRGGYETRLRLNRDETCALLVFRLLYEEKRTELTLASFPTVTGFDFSERYKTMTGVELPKTRVADLLRRLKAHKLIDVNGNDPADKEGIIVLYPSLALTINKDSIDELLSSVTQSTEQTQLTETATSVDDDNDIVVDIDIDSGIGDGAELP
jgi:hypothetical protein